MQTASPMNGEVKLKVASTPKMAPRASDFFHFFQAPVKSQTKSDFSLPISGLMDFCRRSKWQKALYKGPQVSIYCLLLACVPQPQPVPVVSASASLAPTVSPPVPTPTPSPLLEKRSDGRFCAPVEPIASKPSLKYPIDLVVSPDGQDIYIVTKRCQDDVSQKPGLSSFAFPDCGAESDSRHAIPRSYIYHLHQGQGLEILKINGQAPLSCELGEDIEMDSQGRLYVTTPYNHRIYRIDPKQNQIEQMVEARQEKLFPEKTSGSQAVFSGPSNLYIDENQVYFLLSEPITTLPGEKYISVINQNHRHIIVSTFPFFNYQGSSVFMMTRRTTKDAEKLLYMYEPNDPDGGPRVSAIYSPYPSSLNTNRSVGGRGSFIFNPFNPIASVTSSAARNPVLGDMKMDRKSNIYATHLASHRILELPDSDSMGSAQYYENNLIVFAGSGEPGFKDGQSEAAQFSFPAGLTMDDNQNIYLADMGNHAIRKITWTGDVTTIYAEQPEDATAKSGQAR